MNLRLSITILSAFWFSTAYAAEFQDGPVIHGYGKHIPVKIDQNLTAETKLKVVFDVSKAAGDGIHNRNIDSVARFLNMNVANGVSPENIELALVVHGKAGQDLLNQKAFKERFAKSNPSYGLVSQLLQNKVRIYLCGQSAGYDNIANGDLIEGVQMSLSAMTAHALLNQQGFALNPF